MGLRESLLAVAILTALQNFVEPRGLGIVSGPDGMMRLFPGRVRIPGVAFIAGENLPGGQVPSEPVPDLVPDLAIEVLSESNTSAEMTLKRQEYFRAGTRLVWQVDPETRTVDVYSDPERFLTLAGGQSLEGGDVLPGFSLSLQKVFAPLDFRSASRPAS